MEYIEYKAALEAVLFAAGEPLAVPEIASTMMVDKPLVWELLSELEKDYQVQGRGLMIREIAGGYQLVTKPAYFSIVNNLNKVKEVKLSNASMETLAIIALKQPVTRAEIEAIRGVKADGVVNTLLDLDLIQEAGRKKALGNPILYATTEKFLTTFGLKSLEDLPLTEANAVIDTKPVQQSLLELE